MNPHAKNTPFQKHSILIGITLSFYLFFPQIPPALAMEESQSSWKINISKRKPPKDTTPPITRDSGIDGLWHNQQVSVLLKAKDNFSGVAKTYYSLDGSRPRIIYQGAIIVSKDGIYKLRYYSKDKAGNVERIKTSAKQIKIDTQSPILTINPVPTPTNKDVQLSYSVSDNFTPIKEIQVSGDNSPYTQEKTYDVNLTAKDKAGNSTAQTISFTIDKTAPIVQIISPQNNSVVNTPQITVQYSVEDGIAKSDKSKIVTLTPGINTVKIEEKDAAGNPGGDTITVVLDTIAPCSPAGLAASAGSTMIDLFWNVNTEADLAGYNIYRSQTRAGPYVKINSALVKQSAYTDKDVVGNTLYFYVITSLDTCNNESAYSQEQSAYINATDEREPNDYITIPNTIEINNSCTGLVYPDGDSDFYKFAINKPGRFTLNLSGIASDQIGEVNLYGKTYYPITNSKSETNGKDATSIVNLLEKGDYYLQVSFVSGKSSLTPYTLTFSLAEAFEDAHEINDSFETATALAIGDTIQAAMFGSLSDVDTYRVTTLESGKLTVGIPNLPLQMSSAVTVFDSGYRVVKGCVPLVPGKGQPLTLTTDTLPSGNYYIRVFDSYGESFLEPYSLTTSFEPQDVTAPQIPQGLSTQAGNASVDLLWKVNIEVDLAGYNLYRSPIQGGSYIKVNTALISQSNYKDTGVSNGTTYYYVVTAVDAIGNESRYSVEVSALPVIPDTTPPQIDIKGITGDSFVNTDVTPLITITDEQLDRQSITLNSKPFVSGEIIRDEGNYTLEISAQDKAGNYTEKNISFTIDKTAPVINLTGVEDGKYYNCEVTPVIDLSDTNLIQQVIMLNAQPFTSATTIVEQGSYILEIAVEDKAGNKLNKTLGFVIDKAVPLIEISEVVNGSFYNQDVTPVIKVSDDNLSEQTITLNNQPFTSGTAITKEGQYTIEVTAEDKAANRITQTMKFTIDKTPPIIISSWPAKGSSVPTQGNPLTLNIVFGDALSGVDLSKVKFSDENGNEITPQSELSDNNIQFIIQTPVDKEYKFRLYLEDKAGNTILEEISFNVDSTVPKISADVIGGTFSQPVSVQLQCSEEAMIYYSTDGYPPIEGNSNTMAVKGTYAELAAINKTTKLQFFAVDNAGNRSSVKAETYLFNELPAALSGLQGFYNETEKRVELQWPQASPINGYYVYRALNIQEIDLLKDSNTRKYPAPERLRISANLVTVNLFYDSNVLSGTTYWYGVSVVDKQGMESPVSQLVSVKAEAQLTAADRKEAAKRGLAWIEANQSAQGYWGEKKELRMLAASQVLNALFAAYGNKPLNIWLQRGIFWLRGNFADNNDYLARKIMTLRSFKQNVDEESHRLFSQADMELSCNGGIDLYGWGVTKQQCRGDSYGNDAFCTVLGISAVKPIFKKYSPTENIYYCDFYYPLIRDKTIDSLLNYPCQLVIDPQDEWGSYMRYNRALRSKDGRYGWVPKRDTSIFVSSFVYSYVAGTNTSFYQWILDVQGANGSFGSGLIDTAGVLLWIPLDEAAKTKAINYLISHQCPDGSWNNGDAYLTGLCLEVILPRYWSGDWDAVWN